MDESDLTRLAVEEIVKEMHDAKMREEREMKTSRPQERKRNPMGRLNKRFLGRTLHSVISHNQRDIDRTQENCKRKLRELDKKRSRRLNKGYSDGHGSKKRDRIRSRSGSSHVISCDSSSSCKTTERSIAAGSRTVHRKKKKLQKKSGRRNRSRSRSSSTSSSRSYRRETKREQVWDRDWGNADYFDAEEDDGLWMERHVSNSLGMVAAAYNHINQFLEYQNMQAGVDAHKLNGELKISSDEFEATELEEIKQCIIKAESMSLSSPSASSISALTGDEVDENGVLTIHLSSEENSHRSITNHQKLPTTSSHSSSSSGGEQNVIWGSCISLDSSDVESTDNKSDSDSSVAILSSASEKVTKLSQENHEKNNNANQVSTPEKSEVPAATSTIDLTED